jgi:hypothetical protein
VAVGSTISSAGALDATIVGPGAGGIPQPLISPAVKISKSEVFMSSSLVVESKLTPIRIILYRNGFAD